MKTIRKSALWREIHNAASKLTFDELTESSAMKELLISMVYGVCDKAKRVPAVQIIADENTTAFTDGGIIVTSSKSPLINKDFSVPQKYIAFVGQFIHEVGHILYTHFKSFSYMKQMWVRGTFFQKARKGEVIYPGIRNVAVDVPFQDRPHIRDAYIGFMHNIENILEDAYIENRLRAVFSGVAVQGICFCNEEKFQHAPTAEAFFKLGTEKSPVMPFSMLFQMLLVECVCKKQFEEGNLTEDEKVLYLVNRKAFNDIKAEIDALMWESSAKKRVQLFNNIFVKLSGFFDLFVKEKPEEPKEKDSDEGEGSDESEGQGQGEEQSGEGKEGSASGSAGSSDEDNADSEDSDGESSDGNGTGKEKADEDCTGSKDSGEEDGSSSGCGASDDAEEQDISEEKVNELKENMNSLAKECKQSQQGKGYRDGIEEEVTDEEKDLANERLEEGENAGDLNAEVALKDALKEAAKSGIESREENEHLDELSKEANEFTREMLGTGTGHLVTKYNLRRTNRVSFRDKEMYKEVFKEVQKTSKNLTRKINLIFKERETESMERGFLMGQRFNARDVVNHDMRYFSRELAPDGKPTVAFGVLIDESGSMSYENNCEKAMKVAMLVESVLRELDVPLIVCGHTVGIQDGDYRCVINSYVDFDTVDDNDRYRLTGVSALGGNADGGAITYMCEKLDARPENKKVLIVISDGYPTQSSFYDEDAETDTKMAIAKYRKKGINILGAVIDCFESVSKIYGKENSFDCREYSELERQFVRILKRNILYK